MGTIILNIKDRIGGPEEMAKGKHVQRIYPPVILTLCVPDFILQRNPMKN